MSTKCSLERLPRPCRRSSGPRMTNMRPSRRSMLLALPRESRQSGTSEPNSLPRDVARVADDARHHAVVDRFVGGHPMIAVDILVDPLDRLTGLLGDDPDQALAHAEDLARFDLDVGRHAPRAARRLVEQETGVGQTETPVLCSGEKDMRPSARDPAGADHVDRDVVPDEPNHVMNRVARLDVAAG